MTHPEFESRLDPYLDGELAAVDSGELEAHLAGCPACARLRDERLALRSAIRAGIPSFEAPAALRDRVRAALADGRRDAAPVRPRGRDWAGWRPLAYAAALAAVAFGSWSLALRQAAGDRLADQVLASHVRSLMAGHLTDVASTDQHTVKPWFNGRLDFSPPVDDFAGQGYPLIGGRLDYLDGRPVAALVYGRRQHLINLFLWPATAGPDGGSGARERQGYHALHWTAADYTYWVVSDLGLAELQEFARLVRQGISAKGAASPP